MRVTRLLRSISLLATGWVALGSGLVWMEDSEPITVNVNIEAVPTPELDVLPAGTLGPEEQADG